MRPRKSASDGSYDAGYPAFLRRLCKEEDVLIIPQFVTHLTTRQTELVSPRARASLQLESSMTFRTKESKTSEKFGSFDSKVEDLLISGSLRPPQVGITYDNPEDKETPVAIICKNIYVEYALITAIGKSLKPYPTISCLKVENCCISREIAESLALLLADDSGKRITHLSLDGNEGIEDVLPQFLQSSTGLRYLSLQRCSLDDDDLEVFADSLKFDDVRDLKLQYLNLSMNKIGDAGVCWLAEALRTNRSLIWLSLAGNQIGDKGVACLTEVLQKFPLTYEEIVMRRTRIFQRIFRKKHAIEKYLEERKGKEEEEEEVQPRANPERTGRKIRGPDGKTRCVPNRNQKSGTSKMDAGEKFRGKVRPVAEEVPKKAEPTHSEVLEILQQVESEMPPEKHPLVNEVLLAEDGAWCAGCWSLGCINLAFNYLTEVSLDNLVDVLNFQKDNFSPQKGLLRLVLLPGNLFQESSNEFQKVQTALIYRNSQKEFQEAGDYNAEGGSSARISPSARLSKKRGELV